MGELANLTQLLDITKSGEEVNQLFNQELTAHRQFTGAMPAMVAAIADGILTPSCSSVIVDSEGSAPSDDLLLIAVTNTNDGMELKLTAQDSRAITVKHNPDAVNGIALEGAADKMLSQKRYLHLKRYGDRWKEIVSGSVLDPPLATATTPGIVRPDGGTIIVNASGVISCPGIYPGKIELHSIRATDLAAYAPGWHFCNGDLYPLSGAVGAALNALHANFKTDWGIVVSGENISIPTLFYIDGRGLFLRAVDGTVRQVGSVQNDAMRNITGSADLRALDTSYNPWNNSSGALSVSQINAGGAPIGSLSLSAASSTQRGRLSFSVPASMTDVEFRGVNIGMTPAIFLGV